ncbi:MAG: cytochrome c3 family protein [Desulfuromonadales bacterium]|nr:cytochrome c3 family protein [Desulfuromonadales bacterium]
MKKLVVLFAVLAFVASVAVAVAVDAPADDVVLKGGKMGAITFSHAKHAANDCTTCHHKGVEAGTCTTCHGVDKAAPDAKKAFHDQCKGCHKDNGGPTKCKECHVK